MTDTLQLSSACLEQWRALRPRYVRARPTLGPVIDRLSELLRAADKYQLPNGGRLGAPDEPWPPELSGLLTTGDHAPALALEYTAIPTPGSVHDVGHTRFDSTASTKRIALAWAYDGSFPPAAPNGPAPRTGVCLVSISYIDELGMWAVPYAGHFFEHGAPMAKIGVAQLSTAQLELVRAGRLSLETLGYGIGARMFALDRQAYLDMAMEVGSPKGAADIVAADLHDEQVAYLSFCLARHRRQLAFRPVAVDPAVAAARRAEGYVEPFDVAIVLPFKQEGVHQ